MGRPCPVCDGRDWDSLLETSTGRVMTGDRRIIPGDLRKIICRNCGAAANDRDFTPQELTRLYGEEYALNTLGREEHHFFTPDGPVARSQVFLDWLAPHIPDQAQTILEIGCGEGNLLKRLADQRPECRVIGLEGSERAAELARNKGLDVRTGLVQAAADVPPADVIVALMVLEHIPDLVAFLNALAAALPDGGRMICAVPVQDHPGYDLFFFEHVWHLTAAHWAVLLQRNGWRLLHQDHNHSINHGVGLLVGQKGQAEDWAVPVAPEPVVRNRDQWLAAFEALNRRLADMGDQRLALFGGGEVLTLFLTFSRLGDARIVAVIDEDPGKIGGRVHGILVYGPQWLERGEAEAVLLMINPKYHDQVRAKLARYGRPVYSYTDGQA